MGASIALLQSEILGLVDQFRARHAHVPSPSRAPALAALQLPRPPAIPPPPARPPRPLAAPSQPLTLALRMATRLDRHRAALDALLARSRVAAAPPLRAAPEPTPRAEPPRAVPRPAPPPAGAEEAASPRRYRPPTAAARAAVRRSSLDEAAATAGAMLLIWIPAMVGYSLFLFLILLPAL